MAKAKATKTAGHITPVEASKVLGMLSAQVAEHERKLGILVDLGSSLTDKTEKLDMAIAAMAADTAGKPEGDRAGAASTARDALRGIVRELIKAELDEIRKNNPLARL